MPYFKIKPTDPTDPTDLTDGEKGGMTTPISAWWFNGDQRHGPRTSDFVWKRK